jgi:hypothetical protein
MMGVLQPTLTAQTALATFKAIESDQTYYTINQDYRAIILFILSAIILLEGLVPKVKFNILGEFQWGKCYTKRLGIESVKLDMVPLLSSGM